MSRTYIAGYDGSDAASRAVAFAAALAQPSGGQVLAVATFAPAPHVANASALPQVEEEINADARRECTELLTRLDVPGTEPLVISARSAARGLHDLAIEREAALIALGRTDRNRVGRTFPGSTAERLTHGAPCPVASVPAEWSGELKTIGVGLDDGSDAQVALQYAIEQARTLGARLLVLSAQPLVLPAVSDVPTPSYDDLNASLKQQREQLLADAIAAIPPELAPQTRVVEGSPGQALAAAGAELDLLVVGSRGYGPLRAVLVGSTSRYVLDHAPCPVIVVPRGASAEAGAA